MLASALCCALLASTGASTAVTRVGEDTRYALAGPEVLVSRVDGRTLRLLAHPVAGGAGVERFRFGAPRGSVPEAWVAASAEFAGVAVGTERDGELRTSQAFTGPPAGPLAPLGPLRTTTDRGFIASGFVVDGPRALFGEVRGDFGALRASVLEPGRPPTAVSISRVRSDLALAGELIAYGVLARGQPSDDEPRRLLVREWRTGRVRASVLVRGGVESLDLRSDGTVVVGEDGQGILLVAPGGAVRRVASYGTRPVFAGDRIVFVRGEVDERPKRLVVVEPDGRRRGFGAPAGEIGELLADEQRVAWSGNGCLYVAEVAARPGTVPPEGPCPRSELLLDDSGPQPLLERDRFVPVLLRCVAAPPPGCVGSIRLRLLPAEGPDLMATDRFYFAIPAGARSRLELPMSRRAYAVARREAGDDGGAFFDVLADTVDPAGRRSRLSDGWGVNVRAY